MFKPLLTSLVVSFLAFSCGFAAGPGPVLGQVVSNRVLLDGVSMPSGTTLLNKSVLKTTGDRAVIHLSNGQVVEMHRNSSAYFEASPSEGLQVSVQSGTLSYLAANNAVMTAPAGAVVNFPPGETRPVVNPQQQGLRVILTQDAAAGQKVITVNDPARIDPQRAILLRSADGMTQEIHFVEAFDRDRIELTAALQKSFSVNDQIVQDADAIAMANSSGVSVVGMAAGVSAGAAGVGAVGAGAAAAGAGAAGISTAAAVGIAAGVAGATVGTLVATDVIGGSDEVSP